MRGIGPNRRRPAPPRVESLEGRELLSAASWIAASRARAIHANASATTEAAAATSTPTPREARREAFVAKFTGRYIIGPPQFTDESARVYLVASRGGTNQSLHAAAQVAINLPADPATPATRATATITSPSSSTTGTILVLDLAAPAGAGPATPPTRLSWTVNGASGGAYANALATTPGTLDITYLPGRKIGPHARSGLVIFVFRGQINTTGTGNILRTG